MRERQLETCEKDLLRMVEKACELKAGVMHDDPAFEETRFAGWVKNIRSQADQGRNSIDIWNISVANKLGIGQGY